jgi:hypothetical protein
MSFVPIIRHADQILDRVWLGDFESSRNEDFLRGYHIKTVFNCTKELPFHDSVINRYRVPVHDNLEDIEIENLGKWSMEIIYKLVQEYNSGNTILIHCMAGRQRSAAVTAMLLIYINRSSTDESIKKIRSIRPVAFFPSANFYKAIRQFEDYYYQLIYPKIRNQFVNVIKNKEESEQKQ